MTCPLEVLKTRLQSSGLALRPVFQVQMGSLSGTGVIRPGTVTPGLLQVLRYVPAAAASSAAAAVFVVVLKRPHRYHTVYTEESGIFRSSPQLLHLVVMSESSC